MYERYSVDSIFFVIDIASDVINVTLVITSKDCRDVENNQLWEKLIGMVTDLFM